jgi:hypothetical protein
MFEFSKYALFVASYMAFSTLMMPSGYKVLQEMNRLIRNYASG